MYFGETKHFFKHFLLLPEGIHLWKFVFPQKQKHCSYFVTYKILDCLLMFLFWMRKIPLWGNGLCAQTTLLRWKVVATLRICLISVGRYVTLWWRYWNCFAESRQAAHSQRCYNVMVKLRKAVAKEFHTGQIIAEYFFFT